MTTPESPVVREYLELTVRGMSALRRETPPGFAYSCLADFLLQHGAAYEARPLPNGFRRMPLRQCFSNAYHLAARRRDLSYVEGFAVNATIPVLHAWCIESDGGVVDPTWRITRYRAAAYFGVVLPLSLVDQAIRLSGHFGVLDDWHNDRPLLQQPFTVEAATARLVALRQQREVRPRP